MKLRISFSRLGKYCNLIACPGKSWRIKYSGFSTVFEVGVAFI